jgi:flagellar basal body-associated protein FliL
MEDNISRKAVLVLVIIAVVVSILSTTLVMYSVYSYNPAVMTAPQNAPGARVNLYVPAEPASGTVQFTVVDPNDEEVN